MFGTTCYLNCPFSMYGYDGLCVASCPLSTYADTNFLCQNCPSIFCSTCDTTGKCGACAQGSFFNPTDSICYQPCPVGTYGHEGHWVCIPCDSSCLTCAGPTTSDCLSCAPSTYLVYSSCYSICPAHTYSLTCELCHDDCLNCTGPESTDCTSCNGFDLLHLNETKCVEECYEGDIADNVNLTCLTCPEG